jgi:hypothetical protein
VTDTPVKYRVAHRIDSRFAEDQHAASRTLRLMYRCAARADLSPRQAHRISVHRDRHGYIYEMAWVVP